MVALTKSREHLIKVFSEKSVSIPVVGYFPQGQSSILSAEWHAKLKELVSSFIYMIFKKELEKMSEMLKKLLWHSPSSPVKRMVSELTSQRNSNLRTCCTEAIRLMAAPVVDSHSFPVRQPLPCIYIGASANRLREHPNDSPSGSNRHLSINFRMNCLRQPRNSLARQ